MTDSAWRGRRNAAQCIHERGNRGKILCPASLPNDADEQPRRMPVTAADRSRRNANADRESDATRRSCRVELERQGQKARQSR